MTDEADRASQEVERDLAEAMRLRRPVGPVANGRCHYCDEALDDDMRWCDIECREAWESLTRRR
jgi:hypothetical protein